MPQRLVNVKVHDKSKMHGNKVIADAIKKSEKLLGSNGRVLIRPSGTEQLVRVMVEAVSAEQMERVIATLVGVVETELA